MSTQDQAAAADTGEKLPSSETQDQAAAADIRYTRSKLPAHLGSDPSPETLKNWFTNYGWVWVWKIVNKSGKTVKFHNPWGVKDGEIPAGKSEFTDSQGYFPLWTNYDPYTITYYNKSLSEEKTIRIKDLDGNWWISFNHDGDDEDIRTIPTKFGATWAGIVLTIHPSGYEIYNQSRQEFNGRIAFVPERK